MNTATRCANIYVARKCCNNGACNITSDNSAHCRKRLPVLLTQYHVKLKCQCHLHINMLPVSFVCLYQTGEGLKSTLFQPQACFIHKQVNTIPQCGATLKPHRKFNLIVEVVTWSMLHNLPDKHLTANSDQALSLFQLIIYNFLNDWKVRGWEILLHPFQAWRKNKRNYFSTLFLTFPHFRKSTTTVGSICSFALFVVEVNRWR
jgi:hypothetical protein